MPRIFFALNECETQHSHGQLKISHCPIRRPHLTLQQFRIWLCCCCCCYHNGNQWTFIRWNVDWSNLYSFVSMIQGSQTCGLRAVCGPPVAFARPANMSKTDKIQNFDQIWPILRAFLINCGPQKIFSIKLWPTEHFSLECGPLIHLSLKPQPVLIRTKNYFETLNKICNHFVTKKGLLK